MPVKDIKSAEPKDEESTTVKPPLATRRHSKFYFDNTLVVIQIEETLFNVHKYQLIKSETFSDMFSVPKAESGEPEEGSSPDHPIVMEGVSASDFEALLTVLYATHFSTHQPAPEASLIIPSFRLANMWNFSDLRAYLLPLAEKVLDDVDKISFAREFDIKDWLTPCHVRLCQRADPLTTEEANKLGINSLLMISHMRERPPNQGTRKNSFNPGNYYCVLPGRASGSEKPPLATKRHPMFYFDNTLVVIQIEDTLFNVHKYQLLKSEVFANMFQLPKEPPDTPDEGSSPDHPIVMKGVSAADFAALLRVLYATTSIAFPSHFTTNQPAPSPDLIVPAFRLANMWDFSDLCSYLLPLAADVLSDADKIAFAKEFQVTQWIGPAHVRLCQRDVPLSHEEATKIGLNSLLFISRVREEALLARISPQTSSCCGYVVEPYCPSCATSPCAVAATPMQDSTVEEKVEAWIRNGCQVPLS